MVVNIQFRYISCKFMCIFYQCKQIRLLAAQPVALLDFPTSLFFFRDCRSSLSNATDTWVLQTVFASKTHSARFLTAPEAFRSLFSLHFRLRSGLSDSFSLKDPRRAVPDCSEDLPESLFTPFPMLLGSLRQFSSQRPAAHGSGSFPSSLLPLIPLLLGSLRQFPSQRPAARGS